MQNFYFSRKNKFSLIVTFVCILFSTSGFAQNGARLDMTFASAGNDANYWYVHVRMAAGTNYITNNSDYGTINPMGSFTAVNLRYTTVGVTASAALAPTIGTNFTAVPGITSGFTTFLSAGGCYPSEPVYNISISRAAPAPDAGATPLIIGTLSFPKASFPAGVVVTLRPNTSQPCASRESFWSSPANLPARQLLGGNAIALPLKLLSFTATEKDCAAKLQWETDDEQNASYFEIEQSTDAVQYKSIGKVSALGNGGGKKYQTSVPQFSTSAFYRLKMVDIDGAYKYSNVLNLKQNCLSKAGVTIRVYPNPASRNEPVTVDITTPQTGAGLLQFFAADGRIVLSRPINFTSEFNRILLPTGSLVKGTYLLKLTGTNGEKIANVQKVVIY